jgi:hypothetical protein
MRIFITFSGLFRAALWLFVLGVVFGVLFAVMDAGAGPH